MTTPLTNEHENLHWSTIPLEILRKASQAIFWSVVLVDNGILMCSYREKVNYFAADNFLWPQVSIIFPTERFLSLSLSLSLSLDCRLRIFYLFSLCYFQTVNSKKVWIKNMESKVYESFSNFFNFPDTALKLGAYHFQSNLANVAITQF